MSLLVNLINFGLESKNVLFLNYYLESSIFLAYFHYGNWLIRIQNEFSDSKTEVDAVLS